MPISNYRIKRTDSRNITIQKQFPNGDWANFSYHGNSGSSLVSGIFNVIGAEHTPADVKLTDALEKLQLELSCSLFQVQKMIKEAHFGNTDE